MPQISSKNLPAAKWGASWSWKGWEAKAWEGQHRKIPTGEPPASNSPLRPSGGKQEDKMRACGQSSSRILTHWPREVPPSLCPRPGLCTLHLAGMEGLSSQEMLELAVQLACAVFSKVGKGLG